MAGKRKMFPPLLMYDKYDLTRQPLPPKTILPMRTREPVLTFQGNGCGGESLQHHTSPHACKPSYFSKSDGGPDKVKRNTCVASNNTDQVHGDIMRRDILPPLRFHASVTHPRVTTRRCRTKCPMWTVGTSRYEHLRSERFQIFRPMLYSVLMTTKVLPDIETSGSRRSCRELGNTPRITSGNSCRSAEEKCP